MESVRERSPCLARCQCSSLPCASPQKESLMTRTIQAPRGTQLTCKNWQIEAAYRMLQNNLDPQVAVDPDNLIVYGGRERGRRHAGVHPPPLAAAVPLDPDATRRLSETQPE